MKIEAPAGMSGQIVELCRKHTLYEWSAQAARRSDSRWRAPRASTSGRPRASGTSTSTAS